MGLGVLVRNDMILTPEHGLCENPGLTGSLSQIHNRRRFLSIRVLVDVSAFHKGSAKTVLAVARGTDIPCNDDTSEQALLSRRRQFLEETQELAEVPCTELRELPRM